MCAGWRDQVALFLEANGYTVKALPNGTIGVHPAGRLTREQRDAVKRHARDLHAIACYTAPEVQQ